MDEMDRPGGERKVARIEKFNLVKEERGGREERSRSCYRCLSSLLALMQKMLNQNTLWTLLRKRLLVMKVLNSES